MWGRLFGRDDSSNVTKEAKPEEPKPVVEKGTCPWKDCSCGPACKCGASCTCGSVRK